MTISRRTFALTAALALGATASLAAPQDQVTTAPAVTIKQPKPKLDQYKGRVLAFNMANLIVQSTENEKMVWSFQYSADLRQKVVDMMNNGPYQYGDMIRVYCNPGTTVAVKLKGKPSKSS